MQLCNGTNCVDPDANILAGREERGIRSGASGIMPSLVWPDARRREEAGSHIVTRNSSHELYYLSGMRARIRLMVAGWTEMLRVISIVKAKVAPSASSNTGGSVPLAETLRSA